MFRAPFITFILIFSLSAYAQDGKWEVRKYHHQENVVVIGYSEEGFTQFSEAVESVPEGIWIKYVWLGRLLHFKSSELQEDLMAYFAAQHPKALRAALESAGNLHNPKVIALKEAFASALLTTRYVSQLNKVLSQRCHEITEVSFEKFFLIKQDDTPKFDAMVWLVTKPCL